MGMKGDGNHDVLDTTLGVMGISYGFSPKIVVSTYTNIHYIMLS